MGERRNLPILITSVFIMLLYVSILALNIKSGYAVFNWLTPLGVFIASIFLSAQMIAQTFFEGQKASVKSTLTWINVIGAITIFIFGLMYFMVVDITAFWQGFMTFVLGVGLVGLGIELFTNR